ncbi:MAG: hypothetical protein J6O23_08900 [Prevotella sp.]|nr:hypothetical protein [Prevotella sp.]
MDNKRILISLFLLLAVASASWAQYAIVTANPQGSAEVRVGKSQEMGAFQDGGDLIADAAAGETVYFEFNPYAGHQFVSFNYGEALTSDDVTHISGNLYSFVMPEGVPMVQIIILFEDIPEVVTGVDINEENFPDAHFRAWLLAQSYGTDAIITDAEMATITKITAPACGIETLSGIEHFTELTELKVQNFADTPEEDRNKISSVDLSAFPKLRTLWCSYNNIGALDLTPCPELRDLQCDHNVLTSLDVSHNEELRLLYCMDNQLTTLDLSHNTGLAVVACNGNQLTMLNVAQCLQLEQLYCENNQLTAIDVANHAQLMLFNCNDNQLSALNVAGCTKLFQLYCYNNQIKGEAMDVFVGSLQTDNPHPYMVIVDMDSETEQNEMTEAQAAAAKALGWSVEGKSGDGFVPLYNNGSHDYVDLGLPSGTLWATCNVGATRPQAIGLFFAWGDTDGHGNDLSDGYLFSWENYKWAEVEGEETYFTKYCTDNSRGKDDFADGKTVLDTEDDAAYVNWGSQWRMPTYAQLTELRETCTWTATTYGDVTGYEVTGPNGNTIFLPQTGWRIDDKLNGGSAYWSCSTNPKDDGGAYYLGWEVVLDETRWYSYGGRLDGQCVRAVRYDADRQYTVTIPASGIGTFSADRNVTVPEGLTAYTCTDYSSATASMGVRAVSGGVIPAETGVLLRGTPGETYTLNATTDDAAAMGDNALVAVTVPMHVEPTHGEYTNFMLKSGAFVRIAAAAASSKMPAGKAYLQLPTEQVEANGARGIALRWDNGDTTGISDIKSTAGSETVYYDLQGRRLAEPADGSDCQHRLVVKQIGNESRIVVK